MTHLEFFRCDECGKDLERVECSANQLNYALIDCTDRSQEFHFCSEECLRKFVSKNRDEWKNKKKEGELDYLETVGGFVRRFLRNG